MIVGDIMRRNARLFPEKTAVVRGEARLTFSEINERANRLANGLLALGLKKGDCVAILLKNCHRSLEFPHALAKAGLVGVTLNFRLHPSEWVHILNNSEASTLIVGTDFVDPVQSVASDLSNLKNLIGVGESSQCPLDYEQMLLESESADPSVSVHEDDALSYLYTSGATGRPKGAMLTHGNLTSSGLKYNAEVDYKFDDIYLACMPLYHSVNIPLLSYVMRGCTSVIMNFDPENVLRTIQQERITSTLCTVLPREDHITNGPREVVKRLGCVGREIMAVRVRVVNEHGRDAAPGEIGEIIVKGDAVMKGYWKQPEATAEALKDGWMYTGDMATLDEAGYIYLVDRKHDMILSGGANIYPKEIENVIYAHPAVHDVAVIGVPDDKWGEAALALVVCKEGASCTEDASIQHCAERLAGDEKPREVECIEKLPRDLVGKLDRKSLRENYWVGHERRVH